jgi:uncharacterized protein DUF1003
MPFVGLHLGVYTAWIVINLGRTPGVPRFDPSFVILAMEAFVEAIFPSTFIPITQNRMQAQGGLAGPSPPGAVEGCFGFWRCNSFSAISREDVCPT